MLIDTIHLLLSLIAPISDTLDLTGMQGFSSVVLHYGSAITQMNPSTPLDWILTFADMAGVAAIGFLILMR